MPTGGSGLERQRGAAARSLGVRGDELRAFRGVLLGLALGAGLWLGLIYLAVRR